MSTVKKDLWCKEQQWVGCKSSLVPLCVQNVCTSGTFTLHCVRNVIVTLCGRKGKLCNISNFSRGLRVELRPQWWKKNTKHFSRAACGVCSAEGVNVYHLWWCWVTLSRSHREDAAQHDSRRSCTANSSRMKTLWQTPHFSVDNVG